MPATRSMLDSDTLRKISYMLDRTAEAAEDNDLKMVGNLELYDEDNNRLGSVQFVGYGGSFVATWDD